MPFQLRSAHVAEAAQQRGLLAVEIDERLDRRRHRDLGGARVVAVVDLDRDAEAALGERGAEHRLRRRPCRRRARRARPSPGCRSGRCRRP